MSVATVDCLWSQIKQADTSSDLGLLYSRLRAGVLEQPQFAMKFVESGDAATKYQRLSLILTLRESWALKYSETWQRHLLLAQHIKLSISATSIHFDNSRARIAQDVLNESYAAYQIERAVIEFTTFTAQQLSHGNDERHAIRSYWHQLPALPSYWLWQWFQMMLIRPNLTAVEVLNDTNQSNLFAPWIQAQNQQLQVRAPHGLLNYLKHFREGGGQLSALVTALQQRPQLANALVQFADEEMCKQGRNNALSNTPLQQALLWLGPQRSAIAIATSALASQLQSCYFPLQPLLMQEVRFTGECLRLLSHSTGVTLPASSQLLALLWSASLFRSQQLQHLPRNHQALNSKLGSWHCSAWFGLSQPARHRKISQELAKRWQLPNRVARMVAEPFSEDLSPEAALLLVASSTVVYYFHPRTEIPLALQRQLAFALKRLGLNNESYQRVLRHISISQQAWCPLPTIAT